jgi:NADPH:quinone reductase
MPDRTTTAVRIHEHGGPDVLRVEDLPTPTPGRGQVLLDVEVAGVNFIDIRQRSGDKAESSFPLTLGWEGAGEVAALGDDVDDLEVGDRVAWHWHLGSYASRVVVPAADLVRLPDGISTTVAGSVMLQGLTAYALARSSYPIRSGETCLVHSAAGGVGGLLTQMAKARGARVVGTVSRSDKVAAAREVGADEVIVHTEPDWPEAVRDIADGRGVDVVYDGVGRDTFLDGLDVLRPGGYLILYGQASGPVAPFDTHLLQAGGGRYLTRAAFGQHINDRASLLKATKEIFDWIESGELNVRIAATYRLEQAATAHQALASRTVSGKLLLTTG